MLRQKGYNDSNLHMSFVSLQLALSPMCFFKLDSKVLHYIFDNQFYFAYNSYGQNKHPIIWLDRYAELYSGWDM